MKKLINALTFLAVTFNVIAVFAQKDVEAVKLKSTLEKENLSREEMDEAYNKLSEMIEAKKVSLPMKDLLELCVRYFEKDGSDAAYDFAYDLKKSNSKEFEKALKELSAKDRAKIKEFIKLTEEEIKNGNG